jgi:two-component system response regulator ChvI
MPYFEDYFGKIRIYCRYSCRSCNSSKDKPGLYDLIILDIKMPDISGFELYSKFKSNDANFKALFLTALRELDDYDSLKKNVFPKMGERHFIQKPISEKDLLEQVYSMLN